MVLNPEIASRRRDSEEIKNILFGGGDDAIFYKVVLSVAFREFKSFEVRQDIEVPKEENSEGVVLLFDDGRMGYFKIQSD